MISNGMFWRDLKGDFEGLKTHLWLSFSWLTIFRRKGLQLQARRQWAPFCVGGPPTHAARCVCAYWACLRAMTRFRAPASWCFGARAVCRHQQHPVPHQNQQQQRQRRQQQQGQQHINSHSTAIVISADNSDEQQWQKHNYSRYLSAWAMIFLDRSFGIVGALFGVFTPMRLHYFIFQ